MKLRTILCILGCLVATLAASAHQDRIILLEANRLVGLPDQYGPASFVLAERKLTVGRLAVTIPDCIWKYWGGIKASDIRFSASWYHERSSLPPYLAIRICSSDAKEQYSLLLNLDTLAIIYLERVIESGNVTRFEKIPIDPVCILEWKVVENEN
jgi:hypothetical protein